MISDYEFYTSTFFGDLIPEEEFPKFCVRADAWLNALTLGRYADPGLKEAVRDAVRLCECAIADELYVLGKNEGDRDPAIAKETVGSHSVSYRSGAETDAALKARIRQIASGYLLTTGLLYRGIPVVRYES